LLCLCRCTRRAAWTADRSAIDSATARRITLNPLAHIDWIGTVLFPLLAMLSGFPLFGWAKPVPVEWRNHDRPATLPIITAARR
jgi:Zn-dependent protease